jgi:hypothetical protein
MFVFLSGAEMQPERIRAVWPAAQFVTRGRLQPPPAGSGPLCETEREQWGILLAVPAGEADGETRLAIGDDGRPFSVVVPPPETADAAAVLAAARYWELHPDYVRHLAALAKAPVEEYVY